MKSLHIAHKQISYKTEITGENIMLSGTVKLDDSGTILDANGNIQSCETNMFEIIGSYSMCGISMHNNSYAKYRTEASSLIDELIQEVASHNNPTE